MRIRQNPLWLWNPEETSPEIQNRGTSGPKIGQVDVSNKKKTKKQNKKKKSFGGRGNVEICLKCLNFLFTITICMY